ncbi:MAG: NAD(P)/FAD-dependent oxidoreductase [Candidatus Nanohaloarchaea archaeon]
MLVIERSDEVGKPLACSGHVSPDIWDFVPEDEKKRLYQNEIKGARFHSGGREYRFYRDETVSYVIDRVELDKVKAGQAEEKGAEFRLGEEVETVEEREEAVKVVTDEGEYQAKMVAGCDGASSTVREEAGLGDPSRFYQGILGFSNEDDSGDFVDVHLDVPEFFGWRIPRESSVEYGAAVPKGENPVEWLEKVTGKHDTEVDDIRSAGIAAETVELDDPSTLELYEKNWREELSTDIMLGELIRKTYNLSPAVRNAGMWLFQGKIGVHMDRPTSLLSFRQLRSLLER